ncbi:hypothetical protein [Stutzerimonas tarimensis]|uniref:Uncharacterized protein n=1 Tax=Stutzerimonas tarimensis TaxID=1507735 RepID=A0ABV7TAV7_9GAMM
MRLPLPRLLLVVARGIDRLTEALTLQGNSVIVLLAVHPYLSNPASEGFSGAEL